jgi:bifunctional UDP-N-acetylglucosamine pyrophosphorylase/glucosamine-1-phosphate N-acetyltransferase
MDHSVQVASIIMAAGRGSRMKGYDGNKTLLPLIAADHPYEGTHPILRHVLQNLPKGPKALIVNHCKADVMDATGDLEATYYEQPVLNGTGGAILAAGEFVDQQENDACFIITMGDVPFVRASTYTRLVQGLESVELVVLGFSPEDKKKYGVLEIDNGQVRKITEWQYWKDYPLKVQDKLTVCNSGIYAMRRQVLTKYLPVLASRPQIVYKEINGKQTAIEEFFITDLIEYMVADGRSVGYLVAEDELETMGIDDLDALTKAQAHYRSGIEGTP